MNTENNIQPIGKILPRAGKRPKITPKDFEEITLTPEELEDAVYEARWSKYFDEKDRKEKALKAKELMDALTPFTATELKEFVLKNNPHFKIDAQNEQIFLLLCQYFSNDPQFEKSGFSLSKGIMLSGPVGIGKTELLRLFNKNKRQSFHLISVFDIEKDCLKNGVERYETYTGMVPGCGSTPASFYQKSVGWAFDDIGRESMIFDFGNKSDVVSRIIQTRYLNKNKIPFSTLHLTTNLTSDEIETRYEYAVKSRLREIFNYFQMDGEDRR